MVILKNVGRTGKSVALAAAAQWARASGWLVLPTLARCRHGMISLDCPQHSVELAAAAQWAPAEVIGAPSLSWSKGGCLADPGTTALCWAVAVHGAPAAIVRPACWAVLAHAFTMQRDVSGCS